MDSKKKILLVEDEQSLAKLYEMALIEGGFEVEKAADGEEGLVKAREYSPVLALVDVMMPKLSGIEVLKRLKADEETKNIIVVMLTNFGQEHLIKEAFDNEAADFILKYQSTPREVSQRVTQILGGEN